MSNTNCGIYAIINNIDQKIYIGSSKDLKRREKDHFNLLEKNKHVNKHLQHAFNKYGKNSFEYKVLKVCKEKDLLTHEQYYMNKYNSTNMYCGYNASLIAGKITYTITDELRRKRSEMAKGNKRALGKRYKRSDETKLKISIANKGKSKNLGRKHSEDAKRKMSLAHMGKKRSKEVTEKICEKRRKYSNVVSEWIRLKREGVSKQNIAKLYHTDTRTVNRYFDHIIAQFQ